MDEEESLLARIMITEQLKEYGYTQTSGDRFSLNREANDRFKEARSSASADMLGVGVSAYSHFLSAPWHSWLFRNATDIDEYMKMTSGGRLPVKSGRNYTPDERKIARLVLELKNGITLSDEEKEALLDRKWNYMDYDLFRLFSAWEYRKRIPELMKHGLLKLNGDMLQFTPKGRLFENEICRKLYSPSINDQDRGRTMRAFLKELWWDVWTAPKMVKA